MNTIDYLEKPKLVRSFASEIIVIKKEDSSIKDKNKNETNNTNYLERPKKKSEMY